MPLPHGLLPLYMTTDNFCEKLGSPLQKIFFYFTTRIFALAGGGTGKKFSALNPFHYPTDKWRRFVSHLSRKRAKKRSACLHDRRFQKAAVIRLCPDDPLCFSAITGRYRPLHLAAAGARRTPDTARSAAVRPPRDSSARRPPFCGWTAPRKTAF